MIEKMEYEGNTFAIVLRHNYEQEGVNFITSPENPLQLGVLNHRQGTEIKPHIHRGLTKTVNEVQEILHVDYGEVEAKFYDANGRKLGQLILNTGDTILLLSGGHGFSFLRDSKIIEVKQGPYVSREEDKTLLEVGE